jgi:hypothetical protein
MPYDSAKTIDRLTWEGWADARTALVLAIVLAIGSAWLLWRERRALGNGWAIVFWFLRTVAFGCALWMLAGPTRVHIERDSTEQSIAVFADGSDSMDVVDAAGDVETSRWQMAASEAGAASMLARCDRLAVALGAAASACGQLTLVVDEHGSRATLARSVTGLERIIDRASGVAEALVENDSGAFAARAAQIADLLRGPVGEAIEAVQSSSTSSDLEASDVIALALDRLAETLASARRRTAVLAADIARAAAEQGAGAASRGAALTRRQRASQTLDAFDLAVRDSLGSEVTLHRYRFDGHVTPIGAESDWSGALAPGAATGGDEAPGRAATNLSAVLEQLAASQANRAPRMAVILSDGRHNVADARPPQDVAAGLSHLPVYVVPIGSSVQLKDALLYRVEAPAAVAEKDSAVIDVLVSSMDCAGEATWLVLKRDGVEVDRQPVSFTAERSDHRAQFTVTADALGWQEYLVEVEPVADEENTANNYMPVSFEVVRATTRVLLADSVARWEHRYLSQLFHRDEHVEFDELLFQPRLQGSGGLAQRPEFPRDVEGWARYDVVILGDVSPQQLPPASQKALEEYVRTRGGRLLAIAGAESMPAAFANQPIVELLPVTRGEPVQGREGQRVWVTDEGARHSALSIEESPTESTAAWERIYERFRLFDLSEYSVPKPTAHTLLEAATDAEGSSRSRNGAIGHSFLSWHRVGSGRVAFLAAPQTYRLRWREGDRMHHRFWGQFLRWMTADESGAGVDLVRIQTDRARYASGEAVAVTAWLKDAEGRPLAGESIQAKASTFGGGATSAAMTADEEMPGRYFATLAGLSAGAYQITVEGKIVDELLGDQPKAEATISVLAAESVELMNTQANRALLEQVAQATGGQVIPPTALGELLELVSFDPIVTERVERTPLWNRWSNLALVLGCLVTEWIVRKRKGLA